MEPAIFLDRDGTIIEEKNYISRPHQVVILPGAVSGLLERSGGRVQAFNRFQPVWSWARVFHPC